MKELAQLDQGKYSFKLIKDSNYLIVDSFGKEFVVDFPQFQRISKALFIDKAEFITVNEKVLNARYVYLIEPTQKLTAAQLKIKHPNEIFQEGVGWVKTVESTTDIVEKRYLDNQEAIQKLAESKRF